MEEHNCMNENNRQGGFITLIILLVIVFIILGIYGFSVQKIVETPGVHTNLEYAKSLVIDGWNTLVVVPVTFIWNKGIIALIWNPILSLVAKIQSVVPESYRASSVNQPM